MKGEKNPSLLEILPLPPLQGVIEAIGCISGGKPGISSLKPEEAFATG